jgi:hypothetical protein
MNADYDLLGMYQEVEHLRRADLDTLDGPTLFKFLAHFYGIDATDMVKSEMLDAIKAADQELQFS